MTEHCLICGSLNVIHEPENNHAWECWNCQQKWWIDDQARLEYQVHYDIDITQAELDLIGNMSGREILFADTKGEL